MTGELAEKRGPSEPAAAASLITRIAQEREQLPPAHRRLAAYVLAHPFQAATMGIEALAAAGQVSTATVNRFARRMGFDGFPGLRAAMVDLFQQTLAPVEKLRERSGGNGDGHDLVQGSLDAAARNLVQAGTLLTPETCVRSVDLVLEAQRIFVLGLGISAVMARLATTLLKPHVRSIEAIDGSGGPERMIGDILRLGPGDLVIAITVPRYSRLTLDLLQSARARGAAGLGLTDGPSSPIVPHCDAVLFGPAEHVLIHGSITALVAILEGLASAAASRRDSVEAATELTERILPYLFIDDPGFSSDR